MYPVFELKENNWRWQLANRITMLEDLEKVINLKETG